MRRKGSRVTHGIEAEDRYDLVVIGAGGAGSTAAAEAIARGAKVALVERWKVGGTCLNVGCDPTKTQVRSAEIRHLARHAARFGIEVPEARTDWPTVIERVERVIDTIRGGDGDRNIRESGIALYKGHARFRSPHEIEVSKEEPAVLRAEKVIVATGAAQRLPPIAGLADAGFITNVEAVTLPVLPRSLAIIGAGPVGVEFAQIFARLGVEVSLFASRERILPAEDDDLTPVLEVVLEREGVRVETRARVRRVEAEDGPDGRTRRVTAERNGDSVTARVEEILVATGRTPVADGLNLEAAGVEYGPGGIVVDDMLRTTAPHVWAAGDVTGVAPFTHVADYQARIAEFNALSGRPPRHADYRVVPRVTFTDPELARVGLTEREARAAGHDVRCATVQVQDLARAITAGETDGLVKLVLDRATGLLLGGHVLAARGGELLGEIALAMRLGLPVSALSDTIHAYPTFSEGVFWAAYELAKPEDPALDAARGVSVPAGEVSAEV